MIFAEPVFIVNNSFLS